MLENVLDTQNMVVGCQENFLRRLEVGFHSLKAVFRSHGDPEIWFRKVKNSKKFTFPEFSSSRRKKFSWRPTTMFWVSKTFSSIIQLRSKENWGQVTHQSWENSGKVKNFGFFTFRNQISRSPWERKTALREWKPTSSRRRKFFWRPTTMFWVSKTFSSIIQLRSKTSGVRRHANQKISTKLRLLLKKGRFISSSPWTTVVTN